MKTLNNFRWSMAAMSMVVSLYAHAYPGESIVLDPATGNYTITYWNEEEPAGLERTTFVPATKIIPTIRSKFRLGEASFVIYSYTVSNGAAAKQAIVGLSLEQTERVKGERDFPPATATVSELEQAFLSNMSALNSPASWSGNIYRLRESRIAWRPDDLHTGGVQAGLNQAGFGFSSPALPGVSTARMKGVGEVFGYAGDGPIMDSAIRPELARLRKNDFVPRPAAVPTIAVPNPFDPAVTLERIQTHMHTWIGMSLLDATFSAQLDRYFQSAISAYRLNQPKVGKKQIQTMRALIKKEHADADSEDDSDDRGEQEDHDKNKGALIDRLAARVLDFDLKYVTKRMGGDRDD